MKSAIFETGEIEIASISDIGGMKYRIRAPISGQIFYISLLIRMSESSFKNTKLLTFCIIKLKILWNVQFFCIK